MAIIKIEIKNCLGCPNHDVQLVSTGSDEHIQFDIKCELAQLRSVTDDNVDLGVPNWCPIRL